MIGWLMNDERQRSSSSLLAGTIELRLIDFDSLNK